MQVTLEQDLDYDEGIYYPSSDGEPMAETPIHAHCMVMLFQALQDFFRDRPEMYIAINMNWYWQKGNPKARRAPDVMVIPGIGQGDRNSIRTWNEGGARPSVCFEMASKKTWKKTLGVVKDNYEANGVKEYFIFDPRFQFLDEPLLGFRLQRKRYVEIGPERGGGMVSEQLKLRLVPKLDRLRVFNMATGEEILTREEVIAQERAQAEMERARADALANEIVRLKAQLYDLKKPANGAQ
jgi:Uma2 family endonuclease